MSQDFRVLAGAAALGVALAASSIGFAQQPPAAGPPSADAMRQHWADQMRQRAESHAKALHDILNIRPDQEGAFQAFLGAMRPPERQAGPGGEHAGRQGMAALTTPQRLDRMAERMAKRQAEFQHRAEAVRRFYGALSPEQQRAFDALHGMMGEGHRGGHGGDHGDGRFGEHGPKQAG